MTTTPPDDSTPAPADASAPGSADAHAAAAPAAPPAPRRERPRYGEYAPEPVVSTPVPPVGGSAVPVFPVGAPPAPAQPVVPPDAAVPIVPPVTAAPPLAAPAPVHGAPQYAPEQQYAPAPQYTGYQSPLGTSAPGYAYPGQAVAAAAPRPRTVGVIAFVVGLVVLIGAPIFSALVAQGLAPLTQYYTGGGMMDTSDIPADEQTAVGLAGLGMLATVLFCGVLGLWALVQGIVATATKRGRSFGILAIVFGVLAPIVSVIVFNVVFIAAAPALS